MWVTGCGCLCRVHMNDFSQWKVRKSEASTAALVSWSQKPLHTLCPIVTSACTAAARIRLNRGVSLCGGGGLLWWHSLSRENVCVHCPLLIHLACVALFRKWVLWREQSEPIRLLYMVLGAGVCLEEVWVGFSRGGATQAGCCLKMNDALFM